MNINRTNYEIWFTDWLDNNLGPSEKEQLRLFLGENPDLKEDFEEMNSFRLDPPSLQMPFRDNLKKSVADLSASQFDILCVAYTENDLSEQQKADFEEMIAGDPWKHEIFSLFRKLRLTPQNHSFSGKKALMKQTLAGKIFRIAAPVLSAAAMISVAILFIRPEEVVIMPEAVIDPLEIRYDSSHRLQEVSEPALTAINTAVALSKPTGTVIEDPPVQPVIDRVGNVRRAGVDLKPELSPELPENSLIAMGNIAQPGEITDAAAEQYDDRNRIQRLLAFKFREKILMEDVPDTSPLNRFDIAEAGVNGLNKLFGWEMQLEKDSDEGEAGSVNFSSRLVKFTTPVKNNETSE